MSKHDPLAHCGLCHRVLGIERIQYHHLVPKTFGGKVVVPMHQICHRKVHSLFTERELLRVYNTFDALRSHSDIQVFVAWVSSKDSAFYVSSDVAKRRRK